MKVRAIKFGLAAAVVGLIYSILLVSLSPLLSLGWTPQGVFLVALLASALGLPSAIMVLKTIRATTIPKHSASAGTVYRAVSAFDDRVNGILDGAGARWRALGDGDRVALAFAGLFVILGMTVAVAAAWPRVATEGDILRVSYVGRVQSNGTVFDAATEGSYESFTADSLAEIGVSEVGSAWVYVGSPWRYDKDEYRYREISPKFTVDGFHQALEGKVIGHLYRRVVVPAGQGFGPWDPGKVVTIARYIEDEPRDVVDVNLTTLVLDEDARRNLTLNDTVEWQIYNGTSIPARITALNLTAGVADLYLIPEEGQEVQLENLPGNIVNVTNATYDIRRDPEMGQRYGDGLVHEVNPSSVALDQNHPLAGETLVFDFKIHRQRNPPSSDREYPETGGRDSGSGQDDSSSGAKDVTPPRPGPECTGERMGTVEGPEGEESIWMDWTCDLRWNWENRASQAFDVIVSLDRGNPDRSGHLYDHERKRVSSGRVSAESAGSGYSVKCSGGDDHHLYVEIYDIDGDKIGYASSDVFVCDGDGRTRQIIITENVRVRFTTD